MARRKRRREKRQRKRTKKKAERPARLGPYGEGVRVSWMEDHARLRLEQRMRPLGLSAEDVEQLIRHPVGKKRDEQDPFHPDRIKRWSYVETPEGSRHRLLFVFVVTTPATEGDPGEVLMVTVIDKGST